MSVSIPTGFEGDPPDLVGVGLLLSIVGGFLLANSILFRHPRTLVADFFHGSRGRLASIREYIFHRVQVHLGFLFLLVGFGFQLFGHYRPPAVPPDSRDFPVLWVGGIVLVVVALELFGWLLSHALFRRYVREYFLEHPPNLEEDMALARELGELFGIKQQGDDSVQSYLARVRRRIGLDGASRGPAVVAPRLEKEPEEELELSS